MAWGQAVDVWWDFPREATFSIGRLLPMENSIGRECHSRGNGAKKIKKTVFVVLGVRTRAGVVFQNCWMRGLNTRFLRNEDEFLQRSIYHDVCASKINTRNSPYVSQKNNNLNPFFWRM